MLFHTIKVWFQWRKNWDDLCKQCGKCCYRRYFNKEKELVIDYSDPCEFLNPSTNRCQAYDSRFYMSRECKKVNLRRALFNRSLPPDCGYVEAFRVKRKKLHSPIK